MHSFAYLSAEPIRLADSPLNANDAATVRTVCLSCAQRKYRKQGMCEACAGQPWRAEAPACRVCGTEQREEQPAKAEDALRSSPIAAFQENW